MKHITLTVELTDAEAWDLAQFIKRIRFDQCYELTESWRSRSDREEQAYRMLYALDQVGGALKLVGYAPR
jgi:cytochrome c